MNLQVRFQVYEASELGARLVARACGSRWVLLWLLMRGMSWVVVKLWSLLDSHYTTAPNIEGTPKGIIILTATQLPWS